MADQLIFEDSIANDSTASPFKDKDYAYVLDQNGGSYNGQILIDTSTLSNVDRFANYREAYLEIPLVMTLNNSSATAANFNGATAPYAMALKAGFWQLIHSISVDFNGRSVVQLTPYTNMWVGFRAVTELSMNDVQKFGSSIGYSKDSSTSFSYSAAASADGIRLCNNRAYPALQSITTSTGEASNTGMLQRQLTTSTDPTVAPWSSFMNTASHATVGKPHYVNTAAEYKAWYVIAKIRLRDVCDWFDELPLIKGASMKITINTNTASVTVTGAATPTITTNSANISILGGTCPFMVASSAANQGMNPIATAAAGNYIANISIGKCTNASLKAGAVSLTHPTLQACRLYVPLYEFTPSMASQFLALGTKKKVVYTDVYQYTVSNIAAGGTFNQLISNGIVNPKRLLIIPFMASTVDFSPFTSPFDTAPATTTPMVALTQLNIQLSGINVWSMNTQYDFESFMHELAETGVNGGKTPGLCSGLLSELDFATSYRYYLCNLGRRLPNEDGVPKSVQIMGTNASSIALDLYVFVEYERALNIDVVTGQILD